MEQTSSSDDWWGWVGYRDGSLQTEHRTITAVTRWVSHLEEALVCQCGRSNLTNSVSRWGRFQKRLQLPKGFLLFLVLCLLGRKVMTSLPLLGLWLQMLLLVVLNTPFGKRQKQDKTMQLMRNERTHKAAFKWRTSPHLFYCLLCGRLRSPRPFAVWVSEDICQPST